MAKRVSRERASLRPPTRNGPTAVAGYSRGVAKTIVIVPKLLAKARKPRPKPGSGYETRNPSYGPGYAFHWTADYVSKQTRKPKRSV